MIQVTRQSFWSSTLAKTRNELLCSTVDLNTNIAVLIHRSVLSAPQNSISSVMKSDEYRRG